MTNLLCFAPASDYSWIRTSGEKSDQVHRQMQLTLDLCDSRQCRFANQYSTGQWVEDESTRIGMTAVWSSRRFGARYSLVDAYRADSENC